MYIADCGERGNGVFTRVDIPRGARITFYDGRVITKERARELELADKHYHIITLDAGYTCIDGLRAVHLRDGCGVASLCNDANYSPGGYSTRNLNNACIRPYFDRATCGKVLVLVATRDIGAGEEITWSYMNVATQAGALAAKRAREEAAAPDARPCKVAEVAAQ